MTKRTYPTIEHIMKTTEFKTIKKAEGALETLMWLDEGAKHKFDGLKGRYRFAMDVFVAPLDATQYLIKGEDCGTACCIAGAIYSFAKGMNGNKPDAMPDMEKFFGKKRKGDSYYDLSYTLHDLFYADGEYDLEDITAEQAAKTLRKYLKKGVVDWSHLDD